MSAPTRERNTQPLPIPGTELLPAAGNWLMSEHSVLLIPAVPVVAWALGEFVIRPYLVTDAARSNLAILLLPLVLVFIVGGGFLCARAISRGKDGRS